MVLLVKLHPFWRRKAFLAAAMFIALQGCAAASKVQPPALLKKMSPEPTAPVILIPGTTRTKLIDTRTGITVWGNLYNFVGRHNETALALPIDSANLDENTNTTGPGELLDEIAIIPKLVEMQLYTRFLKAMKKGGYRRGDIDHPKPGENLFIFTYDWRLPPDINARILAGKIDRLKESLGPEASKFDMIAHSSAVFIARYYALYGSRDIKQESRPEPDYAGSANLRKLILVNPAHQGLLFAFRILHEGFRPVHSPFMRKFTPYEIFSHPAFYTMMPRYDLEPFVGTDGHPAKLNLYNADEWVKYGWSVFHKEEQSRLEKQMMRRYPQTWEEEMRKENTKMRNYLQAGLDRALLIQKAVSEKNYALPESVETHVFVTEWGPTPERVCVELPKGELHFDNGECGVLLTAEGDHMVTSSSLRGQYAQNPPSYIFLKEQHRQIANNKKVHAHILAILRGKE